MKAVCAFFSEQEQPLKVMDFDGYRLEFADWWFNIRPSNTEPYLRFICEARSEALLQEKIDEACRLLTERFGAVRS
jgi:phosphomannomutase